MRPEEVNPFATARLKRKLKFGPKLTKRALANYALNLSLGRFEHHPNHWNKPGERKSKPQQVPKLILEFAGADSRRRSQQVLRDAWPFFVLAWPQWRRIAEMLTIRIESP